MLEDRKFPLHVKNNTGQVRYVGTVRFAVDEVKSINEFIYRKYKQKFDDAFVMTTADGNTHLSIVSNKEKKRYDEIAAVKQKAKEERDSRSVIKRYADNDLHWRQATSEIDTIEDIEVLKALREEADELGVDSTSAVVRHIQMMLDGMTQFV